MSSNAESRFSDFIRPENIRCPLEARQWDTAIRELIALLHRSESNFDLETTLARCLRREAASSTVIAPHLAVPHVRVDTIDSVFVAIGISPDGIEFPAKERGIVHAIVVVLSPRNVPDLYLQTIAAVTRDLHADAARERLANCATAYDVYNFFLEAGGLLPSHLLARDVMDKDPPTVLETDDLRTVIDVLCSQALLDISVIDDVGDLRGTISLEDILRLSFPEHLLWIHDLSPLLRFKPFADLLRQDREKKAADVLREHALTVPTDMPAIQVAKLFLMESTRQVQVVEGRKLLGVIDLRDFMSKLFWA